MCSEEGSSPLVPICGSEMLAKARPSACSTSRLNQQSAWGGTEKPFQVWYFIKVQNHFSLLGRVSLGWYLYSFWEWTCLKIIISVPLASCPVNSLLTLGTQIRRIKAPIQKSRAASGHDGREEVKVTHETGAPLGFLMVSSPSGRVGQWACDFSIEPQRLWKGYQIWGPEAGGRGKGHCRARSKPQSRGSGDFFSKDGLEEAKWL